PGDEVLDVLADVARSTYSRGQDIAVAVDQGDVRPQAVEALDGNRCRLPGRQVEGVVVLGVLSGSVRVVNAPNRHTQGPRGKRGELLVAELIEAEQDPVVEVRNPNIVRGTDPIGLGLDRAEVADALLEGAGLIKPLGAVKEVAHPNAATTRVAGGDLG